MSPEEYAQMIIANSQASTKGGKNIVKFLAGYVIFYTGGDMCYASERTRGRMDIIVKYGGTLLPKYDRSLVTHIVTDAQLRPTLRALGLKSIKEIPDHIPTIKWNWIVSGIGRAPLFNAEIRNGVMDAVWMHAAFSERMEAGADVDNSFHGPSKTKGKARDTTEISRISEFTQDGSRPQSEPSVHPDSDHGEEAPVTAGGLPSPPSSPTLFPRVGQASTAKTHVLPGKVLDPLAEFYAKAKAERDDEWSRHGETDESDAEESDREGSIAIPKKRGFTCDTKEIQRETCVNQDIIDKLQELMELHKAKVGDEDRWRVFSYSKSIRALRNHPRRVKSLSEARTIRGIGEKTALKIMEIVETGQLRRIGHEKTDDVKSTRLFQGIYGVGQSTAFKWYANGCRTLEDILAGKGGIKLTPAQEIGIRFYDDINDRMPRSEATALFDLIRPIALAIDPKLFVDIMGSYRRGKADCGDIDIMISRPTDDGKTHAGVISRLLDDLHKAGVLTEDLALPEDPHDLEATYRGLCRLPHKASRRRRIDILAVPWSSRGAALIYYTGDDIFNRAIRMKAGVLGYSLNQKGLFGGVVRDPKDRRVKLNAGTLVASETEGKFSEFSEFLGRNLTSE
ncbi:hypothetical protein BD779DRAFT_905556 [Infundibulicybe gibba]|nr:hypothetical protein BD779DRAFT_905556 [Infundibulicybe gibba]